MIFDSLQTRNALRSVRKYEQTFPLMLNIKEKHVKYRYNTFTKWQKSNSIQFFFFFLLLCLFDIQYCFPLH